MKTQHMDGNSKTIYVQTETFDKILLEDIALCDTFNKQYSYSENKLFKHRSPTHAT